MPSADTARLVAELSLDDKKFSRGMASANKSVGSLDKALSRAGKGISTTASNLGKLGAIGGGLAVAGLAASVQEASNLNEQLSKSTVVFGKASKEIITFSETTAEGLGLAQSEALEAAGAFGNMFKTIGVTDEVSADYSKTLVTLAADMASFNNEDPTEMLDRIRAGLSGESEPLKRFGILLSEARVQQEAVALGLSKTGKNLTEVQKVQARYSLILKDSKVQQGDFARTSGSLANQQRILGAQLRDTGATIGTALLPAITKIATNINKLIKENGPAINDFAAKLPGAFDRAVAFAEKIPWGTIAAGLEQAAFFAGKLFDTFLGLPPEVQTTLIALAGLNKLSGGAVTGIVSELGKGLIKGVLGLTAAVVNINAGTVNGGGGVGGKGVPGGAFGGLGVAAAGAAAGGAVILGFTQSALADLTASIAGPQAGAIQRGLGGGPVNIAGPLDRIIRAFQGDFRSTLETTLPEKLKGSLERSELSANVAKTAANQHIANERLEDIRGYTSEQSVIASTLLRSQERAEANTVAYQGRAQAAAFAIRDKVASSGGLVTNAVNAAKAAVNATKVAAAHAGQQTAAAIRDKDLSVKVTAVNNFSATISIRETIKQQTTFKSYYRTQL